MERSPTVLKQNCSPTLLHTKTSTNSSQIEHSLLLPCESLKGSSGNQGTAFKAYEVLSTAKNPEVERGECQKGVLTSRETVSTNTMKPLPSRSSVVTHQELLMSTCYLSGRPQNNNISGVTLSAIRRLPIRDLLNGTGPTEHV